jgi:hypothetical protein
MGNIWLFQNNNLTGVLLKGNLMKCVYYLAPKTNVRNVLSFCSSETGL